jgi:primosomal protein N''
MTEFPAVWNEKRLRLDATVESIQQRLDRCRQTLEQIQPACTTEPAIEKKY